MPDKIKSGEHAPNTDRGKGIPEVHRYLLAGLAAFLGHQVDRAVIDDSKRPIMSPAPA